MGLDKIINWIALTKTIENHNLITEMETYSG